MTKEENLKRICAAKKDKGKIWVKMEGVLGSNPPQRVDISTLKIAVWDGEAGYQRERVDAEIKHILECPMEELLGVILVAQRPDRTRYVMDGGLRTQAMAEIDPHYKMWALIIRTDGQEATEAKIYCAVNKWRKNLRPFDFYVGGIAAKEDDALLVHALGKQLDLKINSASPISTMRKLARRDPELFEKAMTLAAKTCKDGLVDREILEGIFSVELALRKQKPGVTILEGLYQEALVKAGKREIAENVANMRRASGSKTNDGVVSDCANGLIKAINKQIHWKQFLPPVSRSMRFLVEAPDQVQ